MSSKIIETIKCNQKRKENNNFQNDPSDQSSVTKLPSNIGKNELWSDTSQQFNAFSSTENASKNQLNSKYHIFTSPYTNPNNHIPKFQSITSKIHPFLNVPSNTSNEWNGDKNIQSFRDFEDKSTQDPFNHNIKSTDFISSKTSWSKLKLYFLSMLQPSDNKLSMKYFGSKERLLKEKLRQQEVGRFIIHPCSNFRFYWDFVMLALLIANVIILPVAISFFNDNWNHIGLLIFNLVSDSLFLLDMAVNFRTDS
ncbi:voltage-activated ion [Brachionus plicatilis]|uniref:Voltage-activated ion n=1 Tax=Brachionus plicatilis TaxID=10195 RepID=A0A3M7SD32_BRAPC|nr:voltage-activated ion [Brachionus plicatilis]